ncbi:MT-A70 family methyltransferase [uncultured Roseovarius sp.]|uniref:MT-A70 family methyltransferase n=1 Tax=uncultured Roseovarius sp. TaxID=293344 RepID=UPI000C53CD89|nr:DNA methyltransferase [Roseovarius sp.]MBD11591.1 DNA methyltransferase [Roseovarius sp.]|tara:strand:- start:454 stop:999 length:546 start_codon:yes stop_codon:yes gene_type:complete
MTAPLDFGPFDIICADPAWRFASNSVARPGRNAMRHYPCMTVPEIAALPVRDWAARDALCFMWVTVPHLVGGLDVMRAWGFRYVSQIVWVKSRIATGYWARNRHELVLIGKRGKFPCPRPAPFSDSVIEAPTREHSRKPEALQEAIDAAWPEAARLEMFARRARVGWTAWGNQVGKFEAVA